MREPNSLEIVFRPIGRIHTPFSAAAGTPIQSSLAAGTEGTVEIYPEFVAGLQDVEGFERIWLVYYFDRCVAPQLIVRPYLDQAEHGVFATRSPSRPNHIGMSAVRLLGVDGDRLRIAEVDMLDGTPVIDIKPYIPDFDSFDRVRTGWYSRVSLKGVVADDRFEAKGREGKKE